MPRLPEFVAVFLLLSESGVDIWTSHDGRFHTRIQQDIYEIICVTPRKHAFSPQKSIDTDFI